VWHLPARALPPPAGMTEREYAWILTTDRCMACHLKKRGLKMDWLQKGKVCSSCPRSKKDTGDQDCLAREREDKRELEIRKEEKYLIESRYIDRVYAMAAKREWDTRVLKNIPRFQAIVVWRKNITPTDNALRLLESHIEKSESQFALITSLRGNPFGLSCEKAPLERGKRRERNDVENPNVST
jgi:hypothetical protein